MAFSGLTVSIGLFGLTFFRINMLHSVGMGGVLVVLLAVLAALTLLPAMLAIIGMRIMHFLCVCRVYGGRSTVGNSDGTLRVRGTSWFLVSSLAVCDALSCDVCLYRFLLLC